jgi:hypothetical protein
MALIRSLTSFVAALTLLCCLSTASIGQTKPSETNATLKQLLDLPAPPPRSTLFEGATLAEMAQTKRRPEAFFDRAKPPADDAPMEDLVAYWQRNDIRVDGPPPTEKVRDRLLEAFTEDPFNRSDFLPLLSKTEQTTKQVKAVYDRAMSNADQAELIEPVKKWLLFNSKYFLSELISIAQKAADDQQYGWVRNGEALTALANVDWETAEPIVQGLTNGNQKRVATLALSLQYQQAIKENDATKEESLRKKLIEIAADRTTLGQARNQAIETLSENDWSGRDEWYLGLFQDETLIDLKDRQYGFSPLAKLFRKNPEKWIPVMTKLTESKDRTVRSNAADCLMVFQIATARLDALKPLVPWLADPDWIIDQSMNRLRFIQSMGSVDLPESVPGLIWVVEHDADDRGWAAESLIRYADIRAVPALRKALEQEKDNSERERIVKALIATKGLTDTEQLEALESYALKISEEGREEFEGARYSRDTEIPLPIIIGSELEKSTNVSLALFQLVLARAETLKQTAPKLSQKLLEIAHGWSGRQIDLDIINRIANGTIDAATLAKQLENREKFRERMKPEIQGLLAAKGWAPGVAAALLEDAIVAQTVLASGSEAARIALLASARLVQMPLPVSDLESHLKSRNTLLSTATQRYLLAEDSSEARELLWRTYPNQAFMVGWRENHSLLNSNDFKTLEKTEAELRNELLKDKSLLEIIALLTPHDYRRVIRRYADRTIYTILEDPARYRERELSNAEFATLQETLVPVFQGGPVINRCHHNCFVSEIISLTREKGIRIFSQETGFGGKSHQALARLEENADFKVHYHLAKEISGLEILYASMSLSIRDVWRDAKELRVLIEREETPEEETQQRKEFERQENEDYGDVEIRVRRARHVLDAARLSWRKFENGTPGGITATPTDYPSYLLEAAQLDDAQNRYFNHEASLGAPKDLVVFATEKRLWKKTGAQQFQPLIEGSYSQPVVTADGQWIIAAKADGSWGKPNSIVRINLQTGKEYQLDLAPASQFDPVVFVESKNKVLVRRAKDDYEPQLSVGPDEPEYYLVDAETGTTQLIKGNFIPLLQPGKRFLQSTSKPDEFWAAIPNSEKKETQIGVYNLKDFSFRPQQTIPRILFNSMSMWVDESGGKIYLVYENQLLRLPLKTQQ